MLDTQKCNRFVTLSETSQLTSLGKSTILLWEAQQKFPKAVRLSKTKRVWLESSINDWILDMYKGDKS